MTTESIIGIISSLLGIISTFAVIMIMYFGGKRAKAELRKAVLAKLRCKKEEMNRIENDIYFLIQLYKDKAITKDAFNEQVKIKYENLCIVYNEYMSIKREMAEEDIKTEKEKYSKSKEHLGEMIDKLTGGK